MFLAIWFEAQILTKGITFEEFEEKGIKKKKKEWKGKVGSEKI